MVYLIGLLREKNMATENGHPGKNNRIRRDKLYVVKEKSFNLNPVRVVVMVSA